MSCPYCGDGPCDCDILSDEESRILDWIHDLVTFDNQDFICPEGQHKWTGQQSNAPSEPDDWSCFCSVCGTEHPGSGEFPAVELKGEIPTLPTYEG